MIPITLSKVKFEEIDNFRVVFHFSMVKMRQYLFCAWCLLSFAMNVPYVCSVSVNVPYHFLHSMWMPRAFHYECPLCLSTVDVNVPVFCIFRYECLPRSPRSTFSSWGPRAARDARSCPPASGTESSPRTWWAPAPASSGSWCTARKIKDKAQDTNLLRYYIGKIKGVSFSRPRAPVMHGTTCLKVCSHVTKTISALRSFFLEWGGGVW